MEPGSALSWGRTKKVKWLSFAGKRLWKKSSNSVCKNIHIYYQHYYLRKGTFLFMEKLGGKFTDAVELIYLPSQDLEDSSDIKISVCLSSTVTVTLYSTATTESGSPNILWEAISLLCYISFITIGPGNHYPCKNSCTTPPSLGCPVRVRSPWRCILIYDYR